MQNHRGHADELSVHVSEYVPYATQSKHTFERIQDGCDELFGTFELEQRTPYHSMQEPVVLVQGDLRRSTLPHRVQQLLCLYVASIYVPVASLHRTRCLSNPGQARPLQRLGRSTPPFYLRFRACRAPFVLSWLAGG